MLRGKAEGTFTIKHEYNTMSKIFEVVSFVDEDLHDIVYHGFVGFRGGWCVGCSGECFDACLRVHCYHELFVQCKLLLVSLL